MADLACQARLAGQKGAAINDRATDAGVEMNKDGQVAFSQTKTDHLSGGVGVGVVFK